MSDVTITEDGEVIETGQSLTVIDNAALATLARVEIDQQVSTARAYPRSIDRAVKNITALATLDEETAEECCYALVRKGKQRGGGEENKPIEGPSVRLAEIAAQQWGNCRVDARVVEINRKDKYVAAEGVFHDLETNVAIKNTVRRRISTKSGGIFSDDMIIVTGNAACAIAKRNAILAGIPRGVYRPAYARAREIIAGTAETLTANRAKALGAFARFGVTPEQLFDVLDVEGEGDIKPSHIATLRSMFSTLKNGESTVEEMFGKPEPEHKIVQNPLADEPAHPSGTNDVLATGADERPAGGSMRGLSTLSAMHLSETDEASVRAYIVERSLDINSAADVAEAVAAVAATVHQTAAEEEGTSGALAAGNAVAGNDVSRDGAPAAEQNPWFEKGRKAAADGMSRKAIPPELRSDNRQADQEAYLAGFDSYGAGEP